VIAREDQGRQFMAEKGKHKHFSQERQRVSPEGALCKKIAGGQPPPMEDNNFARRAGEIIVTAMRAVTDHRRRGK
jgi:fructose-1,6-bisphosphatase/inositol monophosphatase family enzyme